MISSAILIIILTHGNLCNKPFLAQMTRKIKKLLISLVKFIVNCTHNHAITSANHHGAEISVIWLVERSAIKLLILMCYLGKTNFEVQRNFNANTTLVRLSEIHFRSLFFDVKKRRQCSEITPIPWDLL